MDTSIFYMDEKYTLASFFTTVSAFLVGFLYLSNFYNKTTLREKFLNIGAGVFFIILALDEFFEIHEYINTLIKERLSGFGLLGQLSNLSWIFPLMLIILAFMILFFLKVIFEKNIRVRRSLAMGIICFFLVIVFELIGSLIYGQDNFIYSVAVEEGMEMIGICFFLNAILVEDNIIRA